MLPAPPLDDLCVECGLDIDPSIPRVVSKELECSWHVMCAPPILPGEPRRYPRRYVNPNNRGAPAGPRSETLLVERGVFRR